MHCRITPSGRIDAHSEPTGEGPALAADRARTITEAFARGRGHGVLHLGAAQLAAELPASLRYFRDIGRSFVAAVCAALDPNDPAALVSPEFPHDQLGAWVEAIPPIAGAELVSPQLLTQLWSDMSTALETELAGRAEGVQGYLQLHDSVWNVVGRVCFHLAENKRDHEHPFAFMATYVREVSKRAKPQHLALGTALQEYAGAKNRKKLLSLLAPISRAAEHSELVRELFESGDVYQPLAWTPVQAQQFLHEIDLYQRSGLVVRLPAGWTSTNRPRPRVSVSVGSKAPSSLGMDALLDFNLQLTLGGEKLTKREIAQLLASTQGLALIRGQWVDVDSEELSQVLAHWQQIRASADDGQVSFAEAMRMLSRGAVASSSASETDTVPDWSEVIAGKWLSNKLDSLREPGAAVLSPANAGLDAQLRPYQQHGVLWLSNLRKLQLGGCLADDMGLGKTIQVLGLLALAKRRREPGTDLLVVPASLIDNWRQEAERFAPKLEILVAHPSSIPRRQLDELSQSQVAAYDAVITTYGTVQRNPWMSNFQWRNLILDEAQAIKNPGTKQTKSVKTLAATWRLALTGTPVENRLSDLWSIFDFLNPGLLGSARSFNGHCKAMSQSPGGYAPLRRLLAPYILRRLKTDRSIITDLPDKTEIDAHCLLSRKQAALYEQSVQQMREAIENSTGMERRGLVLAYLMRFKQICNHPSQWLDDGVYAPSDSGKFARLTELCESIAARQDKVLVFTQFREMTEVLSSFLTDVFGQAGLVLHGGTAIKKRQRAVERFQGHDDVPYMVISLKAGGTGLNLTAASHVIHFDRWWNPAVENQATDRAFRIGQKKNVLVHKFVCRGTVEERIDELIRSKRQLADEITSGGAESSLTEMSNDELFSMVTLDLDKAVEGRNTASRAG